MVAKTPKTTGKRSVSTNLREGKKLLSWKALDSEPYQRNRSWYVTFCTLTFGSAALIFWMDPATATIPVVSICVAAALYLWAHKDGQAEVSITLFEQGLKVGDSPLIGWEEFRGYWLLEDEVSRVLVLENAIWQRYRVRLQLGKTKTERVLKALETVEKLEHLEEQKEKAFDLWSRVFRL